MRSQTWPTPPKTLLTGRTALVLTGPVPRWVPTSPVSQYALLKTNRRGVTTCELPPVVALPGGRAAVTQEHRAPGADAAVWQAGGPARTRSVRGEEGLPIVGYVAYVWGPLYLPSWR
ncbi:hypothetical protein [Alienimonas sp. DA493]|uniref:hypothetical protein n=1 Tax=Alienimonas sp. DA493 TaxID=3373605 RepID=UPI003754D73F